MKIKELIDKLKEIADKNPDADVSIGVWDSSADHGFGITDKFNVDYPSDVVLEVFLEDLVGKDSIHRNPDDAIDMVKRKYNGHNI